MMTGQNSAEEPELTDSEFLDLAEKTVRHEWDQFQKVDNEGGRALCQGDWPTFHQMRLSQFLTWTAPLLLSYSQDLDQADREGRNLLTEKYARMMESTDQDYYLAHLQAYLPVLSQRRLDQQEGIIRTQVEWARSFMQDHPRLGSRMRRLTSAEDRPDSTSFETYLRGELGTYSQRTLDLYQAFVTHAKEEGINLTRQTVGWTVRMAGFSDLAEAEASLAE